MDENRFKQFMDENRTPVEQKQRPANLRASIEKVNENKANRGVVPYAANAINAVNRGVTQVIETPYNIINRAPQLVNLLPGEQGVESIDEMAKGTWAEGIFPSKDPLINFMEEHHPGLNAPNPNYPITNQVGEDVGIGLGTMGMSVPLSFLKGVGGPVVNKVGQYADDMVKLFQKSPKAAVAGEVAAAGGAATGRELVPDDAHPITKFAAEFLGALAPGTLAYSGPEIASKVFSREGGDLTLEAMERLDMRPSVGVTGNEMASQMENAAAIVPVLGSKARKVQNQQFDDFADTVTKTADNIRPDSAVSRSEPIMLGEQVRDIADEGLEKIKAGFGKREDDLAAAIGGDTKIDITSTRKAIEEQIPKSSAEIQSALKTELALLDEIADDAGKISYDQLRSHRTGVGQRTNQPSIKGGAKKKIYAGITEDLQKAADGAGVGDDFKTLMADQAQSNAKTGDKTRLESLVDQDFEKSFSAFKASIKNPDKIATFKRSATPEQWDEFSSNVVEYLGKANNSAQGAAGDTFSANTFLTRWNEMDPRTRSILFDDDRGTLQTLDDLAVVAEGMKHRGHGGNFSNTAGVGIGAGAIMGGPLLYGDVSTAAMNTGLTYATIQSLMSETLAKWAAGRGPSVQGTIGARVPGAAYRAATDEEE